MVFKVYPLCSIMKLLGLRPRNYEYPYTSENHSTLFVDLLNLTKSKCIFLVGVVNDNYVYLCNCIPLCIQKCTLDSVNPFCGMSLR